MVYRAGDAASTFFVVAHGKLQRDYHGRSSTSEGSDSGREGSWPGIWGSNSSFNPAAAQQSSNPLNAADLHEDEGRTAPSQLLRVGSYFGEVGLLLPSTVMLATVSAKVDSTLLALDKKDFFDCIGGVLLSNQPASGLSRFPRRRRLTVRSRAYSRLRSLSPDLGTPQATSGCSWSSASSCSAGSSYRWSWCCSTTSLGRSNVHIRCGWTLQ